MSHQLANAVRDAAMPPKDSTGEHASYFHIIFPGRSNHYARNKAKMYFSLAFLLLAAGGILGTAVVAALSLESGAIQGDIQNHWWDLLHMFLLVVAAAGPVYIASTVEDRRLRNEGDFRGRVLVSLNQVQEGPVDSTRAGMPLFCMRSLQEVSFTDFFPDDYVQMLVSRAQEPQSNHENVMNLLKENMSSVTQGNVEPFLKFRTTYADWKRIRDHIKNRLSSMMSRGFVEHDIGVPTAEVEYAWALTYEKSARRDELNDKFRLMLVRKDLLERVHSAEFGDGDDQVQALEWPLDPQQKKYYKARWAMLQKMRTLLPVSAQQQLMMATIKFAVPVPPQGLVTPVWKSWPAEPAVVQTAIFTEEASA